MEKATFGAGCFWGVEELFRNVKGVKSATSGYAGGTTENPSYEQVCSHTTGHAEVVQVEFDPAVVSYRDLLDVFFTIHDPTTLNQQGADVGTQYRSAIFFHSPEQQRDANDAIAEAQKTWDDPIVTEIVPLTQFYPAEEYHKDYYVRNPNQGYCRVVIAPKVAKARQHFFEKLKA